MAVHETLAFLSQLDLDQREALIARQIIKRSLSGEILIDVGLNYSTLDRPPAAWKPTYPVGNPGWFQPGGGTVRIG